MSSNSKNKEKNGDGWISIEDIIRGFFVRLEEKGQKTAQQTRNERLQRRLAREKQEAEQWANKVYSKNSIEKLNDLSDESNAFVSEKVDLKNAGQTMSAVSTANKRAFGSDFIRCDKIETKTANGKFDVILPNGDVKERIFRYEPVIGANVMFKSDKDERKYELKQQNEEKSVERVGTFEAQVFYDSQGFRPIKNMMQNKAGMVVQMDTSNDNNNNNNKKDILRVFTRTEKRLTNNYISNMKKRGVKNVSKILFNRTKPIPQLILRKYDIKQVSKAARESCRAFFTGLLVAGNAVENERSIVYVADRCSEYVGQGDYPDNRQAFPKAVASTFDGIAVDKNTRVIIYEKANFEGKILWDKTGPAIINNGRWKNTPQLKDVNTQIYPDAKLQENFPCHVREWSQSDMHQWSNGSLRVISNID